MKKNFYRSGDDVITLICEDSTGRKIFKLRANTSDGKSIEGIFNELIEKYNLKIYVKYYGSLPKEKADFFVDSLVNFKW